MHYWQTVSARKNLVLRKVDQKIWCWRSTEKTSYTDHVKNVHVLHRVKEEKNILHTITRRKTTEIGHILSCNCLLKHAFEGQEWTRRQGRRCKQLLDDFKNNISYWNLKEKAPGLTFWRTRFA